MKNIKTAIMGFLIGVVLASGAYSLWNAYIDKEVGYMHHSMYFMEKYTETITLLKDYNNDLVTAEYTGVLLKRYANTLEQLHGIATINFPAKKKKLADEALVEVLASTETLQTKIINEENLVKLEGNILSLNEAVKNYVETID